MPFDAIYDCSYDGIMFSFEDSLQRLGLARIDILYAHDRRGAARQRGSSPSDAHASGGYRALEQTPRAR
jgi:D-threo-aldose 1-dehydrogenase